MNHSAELSPSEDPEEFDGGTAVVCVILGLSFLVGAPGNLLVIWTILRHVKQRSHTVVLLLHLTAADLLVLITLPVWIYSLAHTWVFGEHFCKALVYIVNVCMFSSIFFITLMSVERYLAICHPFVMMRWKTKSIMNRCLVFLWLFALLLGVDGAEQCLSMEVSSLTHAILFLCVEIFGGFVVPFIILTVCYCLVAAQLRKMSFNSKQKSMVLVHTVWLRLAFVGHPYHIGNILSLIVLAIENSFHDAAQSLESVRSTMAFIAGAMVFISSTVNPILYMFAARSFRSSLRDTGIQKLFRHISSTSPGEGNREMSFVSKRQSNQTNSSLCASEPKDQMNILIKMCENNPS
uniref:Si:dkey-148a17.5 n=1 Tax=Amphiprion percula TaxID=161767 RepID=A0A3P8RT18_AMPPE